ncbi:helix-hairpin-helix domain-containing protein [Streptomyces sp. CB01373]|uniref:helix-hairpin-helix domain-containing protein n=1 Tax=Streptomyces sp. CB01373 TaxID=2020325 RepID=UPI000C278B77|nr:helix-hairpin-helix domain-containing protein [Streptomyces sp. CB01373]PJM96236.1 DNA helicase RecD [Streptomyces sp. CB01373]
MSTEPETTEQTGPGTPDPGADNGQRHDGPVVEGGTPGGGAEADAGGGTPEAGGTDAAPDSDSGPEGNAGDGGLADDGQSDAETDERSGAEEAERAGAEDGRPGTEANGRAGAEDGRADTSADGTDGSHARVERQRIEQRKAERKGPIESGGRLSGTAADLLAAVRAVESGEKPAATVFAEPEPAPRRPAPEPARRPMTEAPEPTGEPAAPEPRTVEAVGRVLARGGAPETLAPQVAAALGEGAEERLHEDPWQLLHVTGVRPEQADGFARALLGAECGPDDERRGRAFTVWLLEQAALAGHTALEAPALTAALAQRAVPDPEAALNATLAEGEALAFQDALEDAPAAEEADEDGERPVRVLVGLERYALAEESLADGLAHLINSTPKEGGSAPDWERAAASAQGSAAELLRAAAGHCLVLHTGGEASRVEPARLLGEARRLGLRTWAAAHSPLGRDGFGQLLRRLPQAQESQAPAEASAPPVATVAGLLSGAEGPGRDEDGSLALDLLVVLDAPQLDVETAALLVESLPDGARLVLAGDPTVLWSVGPGRVFADLLAARVCPQIASRVPDPGPLGELVSGIGVGELNQVAAPGKEVVIVPVRDAGEAVHRTVQLVADSVPRAIGIPAEQTVVITPGHGGAAGTRALNAALKERLNPGPGRFGGFDPGDRVAYSPAPGRTLPGHVVKADAEGLHLSCSGALVVVPKERVETRLRHGWALTAHQAVGGRWPAVVVVLPGDAAQALSRPWVCTAFSRAARHLSVVHGVEQALPRAVAEVPAKPRTTRLPALLQPPAQDPGAQEGTAG